MSSGFSETTEHDQLTENLGGDIGSRFSGLTDVIYRKIEVDDLLRLKTEKPFVESGARPVRLIQRQMAELNVTEEISAGTADSLAGVLEMAKQEREMALFLEELARDETDDQKKLFYMR